eukprot:1149669-Pelagomonas_calceolata.AAC.2
MYLWFESWAWHAACKPPSMLAENLTTESQGLCSAASVSIAAHYYPLFEVLHTVVDTVSSTFTHSQGKPRKASVVIPLTPSHFLCGDPTFTACSVCDATQPAGRSGEDSEREPLIHRSRSGSKACGDASTGTTSSGDDLEKVKKPGSGGCSGSAGGEASPAAGAQAAAAAASTAGEGGQRAEGETNARMPLALPCGHLFCEPCLSRWGIDQGDQLTKVCNGQPSVALWSLVLCELCLSS